MNEHVDVSSSALHPSSVLQLIRAHMTERPPTNLLFKVQKAVFDEFMAGVPKAVAVSADEARRISEFLGVPEPAPPDGFTVTHAEYCANCRRQLTFFDLFQTGRKLHGDDFMRRFLAGGTFHIQLAAKGASLAVECSACGNLNMLPPSDGDGGTPYLHYTGTIGSSAYTYA